MLESVCQTERRHSPVCHILENYLPLPGTEYQSPGHLTCSFVTILTELSRVTLIFHLQLYNRNFYKPNRRPPKNVCCHCSFQEPTQSEQQLLAWSCQSVHPSIGTEQLQHCHESFQKQYRLSGLTLTVHGQLSLEETKISIYGHILTLN